jgi:curli biogenesis system outer membrane secretion channel CsgG
MQMKILALIAPLAVALIAAPLGVAQAQTQAKKQTTLAAQTHKRAAGQSKVACTVVGCQTIPANCHPEPGMTWDGMPTGFDIIVCR